MPCGAAILRYRYHHTQLWPPRRLTISDVDSLVGLFEQQSQRPEQILAQLVEAGGVDDIDRRAQRRDALPVGMAGQTDAQRPQRLKRAHHRSLAPSSGLKSERRLMSTIIIFFFHYYRLWLYSTLLDAGVNITIHKANGHTTPNHINSHIMS